MPPGADSVRTADGVRLRTLRWLPAAEPWARVVLVHGLGEHAGRYDHVAGRMAVAGLEVHGHDHRGFGASGGRRAYVARWGIYHDDLEDRLRAVRSLAPARPVVLYGHSMGGLMALGYVLGERPRELPELLVLTSPALDSTIAVWKQAVAPLLGRAAPRLRIPNGFRAGDLSRDPSVDERVANDPLCIGSSTARLGAEGFAEQRRVRRVLAGAGRLPIPTYVVHGSEDPIVPVDASAVLESDPSVTRRVYQGLRHETHNEPEWPSVVDETLAWIRNALRGRR